MNPFILLAFVPLVIVWSLLRLASIACSVVLLRGPARFFWRAADRLGAAIERACQPPWED